MTKMIECPICDYHYSEKRTHCPTCGAFGTFAVFDVCREVGRNPMEALQTELVKAHGAERARQLPQSPRIFQTVD